MSELCLFNCNEKQFLQMFQIQITNILVDPCTHKHIQSNKKMKKKKTILQMLCVSVNNCQHEFICQMICVLYLVGSGILISFSSLNICVLYIF